MSVPSIIFEDRALALQQLGDSAVTNGFVVEQLMNGWVEFQKTSENAKIKSMNYEKGTACKRNNARVVFTFSDGKSLGVAVKIPPTFTLQDNNEMKKKALKMHNDQAKFLELFGGILSLPTIYYIGKCDEQEKFTPLILLEDLLPIDNCALPFNEMEVKTIIIELANFHMHLLSLDNGWKDTFEKYPNNERENIFKEIEMYEEKKYEKFGELVINWKKVKQFFENAYKTNKEFGNLPKVLILYNLNPDNVTFSGNPLLCDIHRFSNLRWPNAS